MDKLHDEAWNAFLDEYAKLKKENDYLLERLKNYYVESSSDSKPGHEDQPRQQEGV